MGSPMGLAHTAPKPVLVEATPPLVAPPPPAAPPLAMPQMKLRTTPPVPPEGWTGRASAIPMVCYGLLLLLVALTLSSIALLTKHWIVHDDATNFFLLGPTPLPPSPQFPNGVTVSDAVKRQMRIGIWESCFEVGRERECRRTLSLVKGAFDRDQDDNDADFADQLDHVVRAVQAFMIIGIVFLALALCVGVATLGMGGNWKKFRIMRVFSSCLAFMAFVSLLVAWLVWLTFTPRKHERDGANGVRTEFQLHCDGCHWGYSFWFVLAALILSVMGMLILCTAGEPAVPLYPTRSHVNVNVSHQTTAIQAPPPPPPQVASPIYTAPPPTSPIYVAPPVEYLVVDPPQPQILPPPVVYQEPQYVIPTTEQYTEHYVTQPAAGFM